MTRVAINGFGRIGRMFFRASYDDEEIEVVAINDIALDAQQVAYLLKYDSVYGRFDHEVAHSDGCLRVDETEYRLLIERDPASLPWGELEVDVVVESTGVFLEPKKASKHLEGGANRVLLSAPAKGEVPTIVWGVNQSIYNPEEHRIVSIASCTTNSLAPVAKVLNDEFTIEKGLITTIHAYTGGQNLVDGPAASWKKMTRARAAAVNIVPTTTGAAIATTLALPELEGKMNGMAMRVPIPTGSVTDLVAKLGTSVTVEQVNEAFQRYAEGPMNGVLGVTDMPLVSSDIIGDPRSSVVSLSSTMVIADDLVKVVTFYDNEWGYANRLVDVIKYL
ncbi:MAG: type I glyceraldehyde-3-phosphate dehydrogenase [Candidatus Binatia bacterium]